MPSDPQRTSCYDTFMSDENDNNLINFIATTVETLRERIDTINDQMATKVDVANLRDEMATKVDLANLRDEMATKVDVANLKDDIARIESKVVRVESTLDTVDAKATAIRGDIEQVHIRLDSIDRGVDTRMGQVETDISRLRSVLYLLVKDKPDMLRLLGQPTPGESRP
jgi:chromosome segregation ATPase